MLLKNRVTSTAIVLPLVLLLAACDDSDSDSGTGGTSTASTDSSTTTSASSTSSTTTSASSTAEVSSETCTGDQIAGTWRFTVTSGSISESRDVSVPNDDVPRSYSDTIDGVSFSATLNEACNRLEGNATDASSGISGTLTGVKL